MASQLHSNAVTSLLWQSNPPIMGTEGGDYLVGTEGADEIRTLGGNDIVSAGGGNDEIFTAEGNDWVFGGAGDDYIFADLDSDWAVGGTGNDTVVAANGDHLIEGGDGDDFVGVGEGNATIYGGAGADTFAFPTDQYRATATFADFNPEEDALYMLGYYDTSAEMNYLLFQMGAIQEGDDVVYTNYRGTVITLSNVDLSDLTLDNFMETEGTLVSVGGA